MSEITPAQKTALLKLEGFKAIQKQYAKENQAGSGKRRMKGRGFWDDVYNWFVGAGTTVNEFLKKTKLVSNVAGAVLPLLAPLGTALLTANPLAAAASVGAAKAAAEGIKSLGYGKMKGKGNDPLAINLPNQRMRGVAPKSKMRGAGLLQDIINDPGLRAIGKQFIAPVLAPAVASGVKALTKKMKGGYSSEDALAVARAITGPRAVARVTGRGGYGTMMNTVGVNGVPQRVSAPAHSGMVHNIGGKGMRARPAVMKGMGGTEYGVVSSEFGNVKF